jgi:nucleotidyltransferase substrate binding protein (TIGR01987 family)
MKKEEVGLAIRKLKKAVNTLKEGLKKAKTQLEKDGVIQRFEYTFELFWKTLKIILKYYGIDCTTPRSCIKEGFKTGFIENDEKYLDMLEDRNLTSHIYNEKQSKQIFDRIKKYYIKLFLKFLENIDEQDL